MLVTARLSLFVVGLGLLIASPSFGQTAIAHFSQIEGTVTRLHRFAPAVAGVGVVLVEGDQIVTAMGRAELTFVDGSVMHLDQHTQVAIAGAARIRLLDGRISLRTTTAYTAETGTGIVHVLPEGVFELTANATNRDVLVHVVGGDARIESAWGSESVSSTQTAFVSGPTGQAFVSSRMHTPHDSFVQWYSARYVAIVPPATFLPFAHPVYRQFAYERSLRKGRFDRNRTEIYVRGNGRRDRAEATSGREGGSSRRTDSRARTTRDDRPRRAQPSPARPSTPPSRGAARGAAVREP